MDKITITLTDPKEHKKVVRYFTEDSDPIVSSIYIDKGALAALHAPWPHTIKLTIEAL